MPIAMASTQRCRIAVTITEATRSWMIRLPNWRAKVVGQRSMSLVRSSLGPSRPRRAAASAALRPSAEESSRSSASATSSACQAVFSSGVTEDGSFPGIDNLAVAVLTLGGAGSRGEGRRSQKGAVRISGPQVVF